MDFSQTLINLTVFIETPDTFGSGVIWSVSGEPNKYVVITCKHNLCEQVGTSCDIVCGKNCEFIIDPSTLEIKGNGDMDIQVEKCVINGKEDLAIIEVTIENDDDLKTIFQGDTLLYPLKSELRKLECTFRGYPSSMQNVYLLGKENTFTGKITFLDYRINSFDIEYFLGGKKTDKEGSSGSGVFVENKDGILFLVGIITNFLEADSKFKAINPFKFIGEIYGGTEMLAPETNSLRRRGYLILAIKSKKAIISELVERREKLEMRGDFDRAVEVDGLIETTGARLVALELEFDKF